MSRSDIQHDLSEYLHGTFGLREPMLTIEPRTYFVVAGRRGSGKSGVLQTVSGVAARDQSDAAGQTDRMADPFQGYAVHAHLSVFENIAVGLRLSKASPDEIARRVRDAARTLGLEGLLERRPETLSAAEQLLVAIARSLVQRPELLVLDDPTRMSEAPADAMRAALKRLAGRVTTLHATRDPAEALDVGTQVAIMIDDHIDQVGTPAEIRSDPVNVAVADFVSGDRLNLVRGTWDGEALVLPSGRFGIPGGAAVGAVRGQNVIAAFDAGPVSPRPSTRTDSAEPDSLVPFDRVSPDLEFSLSAQGRARMIAALPDMIEAVHLFDADDGRNVRIAGEEARQTRGLRIGAASSLYDEAPVNAPRYVNLTLNEPAAQARVPQSDRIEPSTDYELAVSIGDLLAESVVTDALPIPAEHLPATRLGHWLEVVAASEAFEVKAGDRRIFLPVTGPAWVCRCSDAEHTCDPKERRGDLRIGVRAPHEVGRADIRLVVYYRRHIVQSQLFTAYVGLEPEPVSHYSTIDYSLSSHLTDVGRLPERTLSLLVNETADGNHRVVVNGRDLEPFSFSASDGAMRDSSGAARHALLSAHFANIEKPSDEWVTRYDRTNGKSKNDFVADLGALARTGWGLLSSLFPGRGELRLLRAMLAEEAKRNSGAAVIQVAYAGGRHGVLPWAIVYDIPIPAGAERPLMPCQFLDDWEPGIEPPLLCPYRDTHREGTLCPFGFWGLAHVVETLPTMGSGQSPAFWVRNEEPERKVLLALSGELTEKLVNDHLESLRKLGLELGDACETYDSVGDGLGRADLEVVYFYCHGKREQIPGSDVPAPLLEVGVGDRIRPADLQTWAQGERWPEDHWKEVQPLVFINGCHTTELTPDLLGDFVRAFVGQRASGVIGTEVSIMEPVASRAAEDFLELFYGPRATVGTALQGMRRRLLAQGNVMGLAYTPYCSASLSVQSD